MAAEPSQSADRGVQLRSAWLGGVKREDAEALQALLASTREQLQQTQQRAEHARERAEEERLELRGRLEETQQQAAAERRAAATLTASLRATIAESVGWSERLPLALSELTQLAAGTSELEGLYERLAQTVQDVVGEHLLASVAISTTDPVAQASRQTERDDVGRLWTSVALGDRAMSCVWAPGAEPSAETIAVVEALGAAVLCSLAGLSEAEGREQRGVATQLGDGYAYARHRALRERLGEPTRELSITVEESSAGRLRTVYGQIAWDASFADAGAALEEIAHGHGGQAYQLGPLSFAMLLDDAHATEAQTAVARRLAEGELEFDIHLHAP